MFRVMTKNVTRMSASLHVVLKEHVVCTLALFGRPFTSLIEPLEIRKCFVGPYPKMSLDYLKA